jgi:hypothetical protein
MTQNREETSIIRTHSRVHFRHNVIYWAALVIRHTWGGSGAPVTARFTPFVTLLTLRDVRELENGKEYFHSTVFFYLAIDFSTFERTDGGNRTRPYRVSVRLAELMRRTKIWANIHFVDSCLPNGDDREMSLPKSQFRMSYFLTSS